MSHQAVTWAYEQRGLASGPKFLLVTLANYADPYGVCFPGRAALAEDCVWNAKTVTQHMSKLADAGLIAKLERRRKNGSRTSDWIVLAPRGNRGSMGEPPTEEFPQAIVEAARSGYESSPDKNGQGQVTNPGRPEPSVEPSVEEGARAGERVRISGKPVKAEPWRLTGKVLAEFNRQAGRKLRLLSSSGQPSEAAKRIYGRIMAYPDITLEEHADIIRRTLASKWWGSDTPSVGVVYGPRVFEENITRSGKPRSANSARDEGRKARNARRRQLFIQDEEEAQSDAA